MTDRTAADSGVWLELVGGGQGWLHRCREAVSGSLTAIAELEDDDSAAARALQAADTRIVYAEGDLLSAAIMSYDWHVAQVVRSLALDLSPAAGSAGRSSVSALVRHIGEAGLASAEPQSGDASASAARAIRSDDRTAAVRQEVDVLPAGVRGFSQLLVSYLTAEVLRSVGSVSVPVLFAGDTAGPAGTGATGKLTVERLVDGPPGLHADPRSMCFLRADAAFAASVRNAWQSGPPQLRDACLVWSLRVGTDAAQPVTDVEGGSLGGALAVAMRSLAVSNRVRRLFRPRSLDPRCAVSAAVSDSQGSLAGVIGLDQKVAAARHAGLRLVVAEDDLPSARQTTHGDEVHVLGALDAGAAYRLAQGHLNRRFRALVAIGLVLVLLTGGFSTVLAVSEHRATLAGRAAAADQRRRDDQQREADRVIRSEQLASRSAELVTTDSGLAGLAALAGYQTAPTPQSVKAMAAAVARNPQTATSFRLPTNLYGDPQGPVPSAAFSGSTAWIAKDRQLSAYSLATGEPVGEPVRLEDPVGSAADALVLNSQADRLVAVGETSITAYAVSQDARLVSLDTFDLPKTFDPDGSPHVTFSPDGRRLLVLDQSGAAEIWTPAGGPSVAADVDLSAPEVSGFVVVGAAPEPRHRWAVRLTLLAQAGDESAVSKVMSWSVLERRRVSLTAPTSLQVEEGVTLGPSALVGRDGARGLVHWTGRRWHHLKNVTTERIDEIAAADERHVVVSHGDRLSLVDLTTERTYELYIGLTSPPLYELHFIDSHRLVAVDTGGQVVVLDTANVRNTGVEAPLFDLDGDGNTVTGRPGRAIELVRRRGGPPSGTTSTSVETYRRPAPAKQRRAGDRYVPYTVVTSRGYVASVGGMLDGVDNTSPTLVTAWSSGSSRPVVTDTCEDASVSDQVSAVVTADERHLVVGNGSTVCRWDLPSGQRLPDVDLTDPDQEDDQIPSIVNLVAGGGTVLVTSSSFRGPNLAVRLIDVASGDLRDVAGQHLDATITADGTTVALVDDRGRVNLLDAATLTRTGAIVVPGTTANITYAPDARTLAAWSAADQTLHLIDAATGLDTSAPRTDPDDRLDKVYLFSLRWPEQSTIVLDSGGRDGFRPDTVSTGSPRRPRFQLVDLSEKPTWKQQVCAAAPRLDPARWAEEIGPTIPFADPCA